ncbi:MAG: IS982 family transposase [Deltaproteobacteria bacterium]|nr:IS982 family transposase [Deltaproteobacteria bacterium]
MLERLVETFCAVDDFCKAFLPQWEAHLIGNGTAPRGPESGLCVSEIITILLVLHGSQFKYLKSFYQGVMGDVLRQYFPGMPCYERFVTLQKSVFIPLMFFLLSRLGQRTGIYYIDSTALAVCHNRRIGRHKTFKGLAARGKTSMGWFFGFKLHLVFNQLNEIVAVKLTPGNVHDGAPVEQLTQNLTGKLFGDKGYLGNKRAAALLKRGLVLMTKVRKNMKALPLTLTDKLLLNARNMAETIIGHIKAFSSLNLPKHRTPINAFLHLLAALTAYQLNPIKPDVSFLPLLSLPA